MNNLLRMETITAATSSVTYYGYALLNSSENASAWLLQRDTITISGATTLKKIEFVSGGTAYNCTWTDRASYGYW